MKNIFKILLTFFLASALSVYARGDRPVDLKLNFGYLEYGDDTESPLDLLINFKGIDKADYYNIYYKQVGVDLENSFELLTDIGETSYTMTLDESTKLGLDFNAAAYSFFVTAVDDLGDESEKSNIVSTACGRVYNAGDLQNVIDGEYSSIITPPNNNANLNESYSYDVNVLQDRATEKLFDISFRLNNCPEGMVINSETGVINWTPSNIGSYLVVVETGVDGNFERGNSQIFKINVNSVSSVIFDNSNKFSKVTPNPSVTEARFEWDSNIVATNISIFNLEGRLISNVSQFNSGQLLLNVGLFESGKYFLHIKDDDGKVLVVPFNVN